MPTRISASTVEPKVTEARKRPEPESKQESLAQQDTAAPRRISRPGAPPLPPIQPARREGAGGSVVHNILQLQRRYGNRYVQRLLHVPAGAASDSASDPPATAKSESSEAQVRPDLEQRIAGSKGTGTPLPDPLRSTLESSFGADFSKVNVHTGSDAVEMTSQLGAQAFTHGSDIYFSPGGYAPESTSGKHLLAHELTHTVQQGASALRPASGSPGAPSATGTPKVQGAWYNFDIPFTDYQFDPSLEGLKTAGNLAVDKAKEGATWVKDQAVAAAEWVVDEIKSLIDTGIGWLKDKFNEIQEFAKSSFTDIKGAVSGALGGITSPIDAITNAIRTMDAGILSTAWRALTAGANAAWQAVKAVIDGVLKFGGGIWETVSGYVDSLFSTVDDLLDSRAFDLLPDVVQSPIRGLYKTVKGLWTKIRDFWTDFWKRLTDFIRDLLQSIEDFVNRVVSYAIDQVIETVKKLSEVYAFVKRLVDDPESVLRPIITSIAGKIQGEAPGKAREVAGQKMAEAWSSGQSSQSPATVVHRSPDGAAKRSTASRAEVNENVERHLAQHWAALDIPTMLWDTVVNMFWPPATVQAIGHEFYELWNTDWKNTADSLFTPRNIFDDFSGFWHDVWSNFLVLLDFPLALWRRLNSILMLLMGYVTIILILVGLVGGAIVGNVPGALAGAAAGAQLAWAIGEGLFISFLLAESSSALKAFLDLYTALQTEPEKQRDYLQIAASTIGLGVAIVVAILFSLLGALVRDIVGRIKGARPKLPPGPPPPKQLGPGPEAPKQLLPGPPPPKQLGPGPEPPKQLPAGPEPPKQLGPGDEPPQPETPKAPKKPGKKPPKEEPAPTKPLQEMTIDELVREGDKKPRLKETKEQAAERVSEAKAEAKRRGYCFVKGTVIQTPHGPTPIETLAAGELVLAKHESGDSVRGYPIIETMRGLTSTIYRVEIGASLVLSATGSHPFFVIDKGWTKAKDVAAGDRLLALGCEGVMVTGVSRERLPEPVPTFNLGVGEAHTYFVGDSPAVLVHNGTPVGDAILTQPLIWGLGGRGPRQRTPGPNFKGDVDGASGWRTGSTDEVGRLVGTRVQESTSNHGAITEAQLKTQGLVAVNTTGEGPLADAGFQHVSIRPESNPDPAVDLTEAEMVDVAAKLEKLDPVAQSKAADFLCV